MSRKDIDPFNPPPVNKEQLSPSAQMTLRHQLAQRRAMDAARREGKPLPEQMHLPSFRIKYGGRT